MYFQILYSACIQHLTEYNINTSRIQEILQGCWQPVKGSEYTTECSRIQRVVPNLRRNPQAQTTRWHKHPPPLPQAVAGAPPPSPPQMSQLGDTPLSPELSWVCDCLHTYP